MADAPPAEHAPPAAPRRGPARWFVTEERPPRRRRASDLVGVIASLTVVLAAAIVSHRPRAVEESITQLLDALPEWIVSLASLSAFAASAWVVVLLGVVVSRGSRALDLLRDMMLALVGTAVLALLLAWLVDGEWLSPGALLGPERTVFPVLRAAGVATVALVSAPHFTRPVRRVNLLAVLLAAVGAVVLGQGTPADAVGGIALGLLVGAVVLVVFGSPLGYPDLSAIREALERLGLDVDDLAVRDDRSWGERLVTGRLHGRELEVKVLGRDAEGAAVISRSWRKVWYRGSDGHADTSRIRAVEHESLMTMVAGRRGVPVPEVRGFGLAGDDLALVALDQPGPALCDPSVEDVGDEVLAAIWSAIAEVHGGRLVHGALDGSAVLVGDGRAWITNWEASSAFESGHAQEEQARDVVAALFAVAAKVGVERVVASARRALGDARLQAALPYLQLPVLTRAGRREAEDPKALMDALRDELVDTLGVDPPPPVKLRRVTWGQIGMLLLVFVAANALVGMLGGIDFAAVGEVLQDAEWSWIVVGFVVAQFVYLPDAVAMLYAVGRPLPMVPLTVLQVAVKFIGLAVPSAAGRVAMNAAFLHKYGLSATVATTQGAVDGLAGFLVESVILLLALAFGDLDLDLDTGDLNWGLILVVVVLLGAAAIVVMTRVQRLRDLVMPVVGEAFGLLRNVLGDPRRAGGLLGSNLASRVVLGLCLWFVLEGIGTPVPLLTALVVSVGTNLLAGLVPIPGGIGVAEATMTALLVLVGVPEEAAFAAAVVYRVETFYLPAVAGFPATRWLQRRGYL